MRLKSQFLISLIIFALVFILIVSSVVFTSYRSAELSVQHEISMSIQTEADRLTNIAVRYFLYRQNFSEWQIIVTSIDTRLALLYSSNSEQQALVDKALSDLQSTNASFGLLMAQTPPVNETSGGLDVFEAVWNTISWQIQELSFDIEQLSRWLQKQGNDTNRTNVMLITTLVGLFGTYFFLMYQLFFKRTLRSIARLRRITERISEGNLDYPTEHHSKDEVGELSSDVDTMVVNLKQTTASKQELEREVSDRKKAEQALLEAQEKLREYANNLEKIVQERTRRIVEKEQSYRELYESFGEAFIATDWELNVIHWNKAAERVTKVEAEDAVGKKVYEVLPEMLTVDVTQYFTSLKDGQPVRFMMNVVSRETGRPAIFEISTYPATQGVIIIVEDKTEEEMNKRLSAIGQTAGMVGHDIRNPLQAMLSDIYLLKEALAAIPDVEGKSSIAESMNDIETNIDYINKIVQDLQDYARPLAVTPKPINLKTVFNDVLVEKAIPKKIKVTTSIEDGSAKIAVDPDLLKRILVNLVNNAVQAMPSGGELCLRSNRDGKQIVISVEDTGVGIPDEFRDKIFSPLFTTKSKGQGFGLAVVKRMAEALGGSVSFESEKDKGTKFTVKLPMEPMARG